MRALLRDLAHFSQAPDLKSPGVRQNRPLPVHETMQAAMRFDDFEPRAQEEMKGVSQHDLRADGFEILRGHGLHGAVSPHRHEGRRFDRSTYEGEPAAPRRAIARH